MSKEVRHEEAEPENKADALGRKLLSIDDLSCDCDRCQLRKKRRSHNNVDEAKNTKNYREDEGKNGKS